MILPTGFFCMNGRDRKNPPAHSGFRGRAFPVLLLLCCLLFLSGCGPQIVFTTEKESDAVFRIGIGEVERDEVDWMTDRILEQYPEQYREELFQALPSLQTSAEEEAKLRLSRITALVLYADREGIALSNEEERSAEKQAQIWAEEDGDADPRMLMRLARNMLLSEKVYREMTADVQDEISDEEARVALCDVILVPTVTVEGDVRTEFSEEDKEEARRRAGRILGELSAGGDAERIAEELGCSPARRQVTRFNADPAVYTAAFSLKKGEVSDMIVTDDGYVILRGVTGFDEALTDEYKLQLVRERKDAAFAEKFDAFAESLEIHIKEAE